MDSLRDIFVTKSDGKRSIIVVSSDISDQLVENGLAYSVRKTFEVLEGATKNILIDLTLCESDIKVNPFRVSVTSESVGVKLYADVTATAGTLMTTLNRNGLIEDGLNTMKLSENPTGLLLGSQSPFEYVVGLKSTNQSSGGGIVAGQDPFILSKGLKYLLQFNNNIDSGDDTIVSLQFDWFEG